MQLSACWPREQEANEGRTDEDDGRRELVSHAEQLAHKLRPVAQVLLNQLRAHHCGVRIARQPARPHFLNAELRTSQKGG
jgi:hypothetical protein